MISPIIVSRDVVFYENVFPFQSLSSSSPVIDPFPHFVLPTPYVQTQSVPEFQPMSDPAAPTSSSSGTPTKPEPTISFSFDHSAAIIPPTNPPVIRKSTRSCHTPYLEDYHCHLLNDSTNIDSPLYIPPQYIQFLIFFLILHFPLPIKTLSPFLLSRNLKHTLKMLFILSSVRQCRQNWQQWMPTIHGLLFLYLQGNIP